MQTFSERIIKMALKIPKGRVATYGAMARAAGGGARAAMSITAILGKAEDEGVKNIPFHRIVYADGKVWLDNEHKAKRLALYKKEGIKLDAKNRIVNFRDKLFEFK
ncbi:MAG: MGMT family protein [bacterium]